MTPSRLLAAILPVLILCSCSTLRFYTQAAGGQMEMLRKARPVAEVMADPKTKPVLKQKLDTVADILRFAEQELQLPARGQYGRYANLGRRYAVWVVFAAPEFSIEPKTWCYPMLGRLAYRGFFEEKLALQEAEELRAEGFDVHVGGVEAYSTLGYFRDPLLNTFIGRDDAALAELIFHELTHQRLYLKGDTDFNEAFATAVGQEGARRWLKSRGRLKELAVFEKELRVEREFIALILKTREELKEAYQQSASSGREAQLRAKHQLLERLRSRALKLDHQHGGSLKIERWFKKPVNNARLATVSSYYEMLPGFEALLRQHGGDLGSFFEGVKSMSRLGHDQRRLQVMEAVVKP